ncbi:CCR4-NOT transcription complex subunit 6-like [Pollicipes pollicipes]|uniref:CCR4-NOT transcription complex subunit 6-like n=1 Tax=Pollicipes pollicipes TaxID=41117 RepID=UPI00188593B4|nr:CCR4-NOT transcription complex subunit 6-like [Pollicipes pollicipes]
MAAAEERGATERRPSSLGGDTQSSSESTLSAYGSEWYLSREHLDLLCSELTTLRLRRQLTPPGDLAMTPPSSPAGCLRRSRSDPSQRGQLDQRQCTSCPSSLEFRECPVNVSQPPQRPWLPLGRPSSTHSTCIFTVMCYNVLCEKYATRQMYGYCPNWALEWEYRKKNIMQEIRNYSADIITLQEVQTDQFYNFFLPMLQRDKYEGIFSPKSRAKTMAESERKYVDGCAIFWRTEKFSLVKEYLIEFNQLAMANAEGSDDMLNRVMTKDNIGLAAMLETREAAWESGAPAEPGQQMQRLMVCTAHIHWDPEFCDVKLIQTMMLMSEIRQIMEQAGREVASFRPGGGHRSASNNIQLLLCGDLNSLPDSGVVEFLVNGRIPANHPDFKELGYRTCLKKLSVSNERSGEFTHPFRLASSYSPDIMPYTNYTYDFKGIIDYIFYCRDTMTPLGILGPLDPDWLRDNKVQGCPHPHVPSDHFSLLVELEMSPARSDAANGIIGHR